MFAKHVKVPNTSSELRHKNSIIILTNITKD